MFERQPWLPKWLSCHIVPSLRKCMSQPIQHRVQASRPKFRSSSSSSSSWSLAVKPRNRFCRGFGNGRPCKRLTDCAIGSEVSSSSPFWFWFQPTPFWSRIKSGPNAATPCYIFILPKSTWAFFKIALFSGKSTDLWLYNLEYEGAKMSFANF